MHTVEIKYDFLRLILCDLLFAAVVYCLPAISHLTSFPLYVIEPFRLMILFALIAFGSKNNAMVLAITLPFFSFIVSGHPIVLKMMLISFELLTNILLFDFLNKTIKNPVFAILLAILVSKAVYYLLKYILVFNGFLDMSIVSTSLWVQLLVAIITALCFGYWMNRKVNLQ